MAQSAHNTPGFRLLCTLIVSDSGGGGGGLLYEMPRCVCWVSKNVPIMKDVFGRKTHPY